MMSFLLGALLLLTSSQSVNFFSLKQDIEIGAESSKEAEKSLQLVKNPALNQYLSLIAQRVVQTHSIPLLKYRFQIVNSKDINSLGFPAGSFYLYCALLDLVSGDADSVAIISQ